MRVLENQGPVFTEGREGEGVCVEHAEGCVRVLLGEAMFNVCLDRELLSMSFRLETLLSGFFDCWGEKSWWKEDIGNYVGFFIISPFFFFWFKALNACIIESRLFGFVLSLFE